MALPFNLPPELLGLAQAGISWAQKNGVNTPALPQTAGGNPALAPYTGQQKPATAAGQAAAMAPVAGRAPRSRDQTPFVPPGVPPGVNVTPGQGAGIANFTTNDWLAIGGIGLFLWKFWPLLKTG